MKLRFLFAFIVGLAAPAALCAQTPADEPVSAKMVVEGHFFVEKPAIPGGSSMAFLQDPEGGRLLAVYYPENFTLSESDMRKAVPAEKVKFADRLLEDYEAHRPARVPKSQDIAVKPGDAFPAFRYFDTDGKSWSTETLKGRVWVLNVWQQECGPCRREMPVLSAWKAKFPEVVFLSASRHKADVILPIAEKHGFTWTHLQEAAELVKLVGAQGFPLTVVVDADGIVRHARVGASEEAQAEALAAIERLAK
ncbi:MAG: TlpA family protein disulfide reductase [Alistipes senegalensis]|nr:TlpA family protein disulfide reductase [Bacteroides cellulosilyticus]MCM1352571.1 TlpA family protein disulfide reductase [Alistipes senegalensis]